jgi:hypothetical protein
MEGVDHAAYSTADKEQQQTRCNEAGPSDNAPNGYKSVLEVVKEVGKAFPAGPNHVLEPVESSEDAHSDMPQDVLHKQRDIASHVRARLAKIDLAKIVKTQCKTADGVPEPVVGSEQMEM